MIAGEKLDRVKRVLLETGDFYRIDDIVRLVNEGHMQSFVDDAQETWIVTRIYEFPRKRVLDIVLVVGTIEGARSLERSVVDFARKHGCAMLMASAGRDGWLSEANHSEWRKVATWFIRGL